MSGGTVSVMSEKVDPRNYRLMYGFMDSAECYHLWDCGVNSYEDALRDGVGRLLGSYETRAEAAQHMHAEGTNGYQQGVERTFLIISHAPDKPWAEGTSGTAEPHTVSRY